MKDMIMTDIAQQLTALQALSEQSATLLPETSSILKLLVKDLTSVVRLDLPRDRTLLAVDLPNLIENANRIIKIRAEGHDPEEMETAIVEITALAADMRSRAVKAIRNEAGDIAISTSVAAMRVDKTVEPTDLTREFRLITAIPQSAQSESPGLVVDVPEIGVKNAFGRITGQYVVLKLPKVLQAAAHGAAVLPAGSFSRFKEGDRITIFAEGVVQGDRFDLPSRDTGVHALLVEAGEGGMTLHGPAVLMPSDEPSGELIAFRNHFCASHALERQIEEAMKKKSDTPVVVAFLSIHLPLFGLLAYPLLKQSWADIIVLGILAALIVSIPALAGATIFEFLRNRKLKKSVIKAATPLLQSRDTYEKASAFMSRHKLPAAENRHTFNDLLPGVPGNMPHQYYGSSINILPAQTIQAMTPQDVKVMRPLPALPAPVNTDTIINFDARKKMPA